MALRLLATLALCGLLGQAAGADPVTRRYDVRDLTTVRPSGWPPSLGLLPPERGGGSPLMEQESVADRAAELSLAITDNIEPPIWGGGNKVRARGTNLEIHAPVRTHARIAALLAALRRQLLPRVGVELSVYLAPAAAVDRLLSGGPALEPRRLARLEAPPWRRVDRLRLQVPSGEYFLHSSSQPARYVRSYVVTPKGGYEPLLGRRVPGRAIRLSATPDGDRRLIRVDCLLERVTSQAGRQLVTGLTGGKGERLVVEQPACLRRLHRVTAWIPTGGACVIGLRAAGDQIELLLVRHLPGKRLRAAAKDPRRHTQRVFDMRLPTQQLPSFPPPALDPRPARGRALLGGEGGRLGNPLSAEELIERIKSKIDPLTWEDERNVLGSYRGLLLATTNGATLDRIDAMLARLARRHAGNVLVRTRLLGPAAAQRARLAGLAGKPLGGATLAALRKQVAARQGVRTLADLAATGSPGQRVCAARLPEQAYVSGYRAAGARPVPVVGRYRSGAALGFHASLAGGGNLAVELQFAHRRLLRLEQKASRGLTHQLPRGVTHTLRRKLTLTPGGARLVRIADDRYLLVELWHTIPPKHE